MARDKELEFMGKKVRWAENISTLPENLSMEQVTVMGTHGAIGPFPTI